MKRVILSSVLVVGLAILAHAQSSGSTGAASGSVTSTSGSKNKNSKKSSARLDNRKIYHFKDGQRSTPTGNEATPVNGGYSALGRDTSSARKKKQ